MWHVLAQDHAVDFFGKQHVPVHSGVQVLKLMCHADQGPQTISSLMKVKKKNICIFSLKMVF